MARALLYAVIASSALVIGGAVGVWRPVSTRVTSALLAFASGAGRAMGMAAGPEAPNPLSATPQFVPEGASTQPARRKILEV